MQSVAVWLVLWLGLRESDAALLRMGRMHQDPETVCGEGFDSLVPDSQKYYRTAAVELWRHPANTMDNATFEPELECWFASMSTTRCGNLPSQADARKKELTDTCLDVTKGWLTVWNMFSHEEVVWFKDEYPSSKVGESDAAVHYKQAMETAKEIAKKELLCLTLFTIDDECVKWPYIRLDRDVAKKYAARAAEAAVEEEAAALGKSVDEVKQEEKKKKKTDYGDCKDRCLTDQGPEWVTCKACLADTSIPGWCTDHPKTDGCAAWLTNLR